VLAARREFLHALIEDCPAVGDGLTKRLEEIPPSARTYQRVRQEIASWASEIGLPLDLAIEGIAGFDLFLSQLERGDGGWGGLIAYEWLQGEWLYDEERLSLAFPDGWDLLAEIRSRDSSEPSRELLEGSWPEDFSDPSLDTGPLPPFTHKGGNLGDKSLDDLEKEIRKAFNALLTPWLKERRALDRRARGLRKVRARQSTSDRRGAFTDAEQDRRRHFIWYARFQCLGETQAAIAKTAGVSAQTVGDAVRAVAVEADLPLRTGGKRGNPRKKKASRS
jgi:hypothetical protein